MYLFYRHVFRQRHALATYLRGEIPDFAQVDRGILLLEREDDSRRPDHFLRRAKELTLEKAATIDDLVLKCLGWMANEYLPSSPTPMNVPWGNFEEWQNVITEVSPLVITAMALLRDRNKNSKHPLPMNRLDLEVLIKQTILPQIRHSALATVRDPRLDYLIRERGLDEMHMHLTGSTEADVIWLDALSRPKKFATKFLGGQKETAVLELLQQDDMALTHGGFIQQLRLARDLRYLLSAYALRDAAGGTTRIRVSKQNLLDRLDLRALLPRPLPSHPFQADKHPLETMFGITNDETLALETVLLMAILEALETRPTPWFVHAFYVYLLILGQFQRLLVQQRNQYGFDQFQKITWNYMRDMTEEKFLRRFQQLDYTSEGDLAFVEGRYAPKDTPKNMIPLFKNIIHGYRSYHGSKLPKTTTLKMVLRDDSKTGDPWEEPPGKRMRLGLVGHFIKELDKQNPDKPGYTCRHYSLRRKLYRQRHVLFAMIKNYPHLRRYLTGFDCASNELQTEPEVFAPLYRQLRLDGHRNFTYHVGEDFVHLMSGIRAIYEALTFLDLRDGNRIGHATAIGIDPKLWRDIFTPELVVTHHERLDDLVVAQYMLLKDNAGTASQRSIDGEISRLSRVIYGQSKPPDLLFEAWELRKLDPLCAFGYWGSRANILDDALLAEFNLFEKAEKDNPEAYEIFRRYHSSEVVSKGRKLEKIDCAKDVLSIDLLTQLQNHVLGEVRERRVAIETLPTSNLRISFYKKYSEHHIFRWLGLDGTHPVDVVVGTDDPGIFATNLRNEYTHLLRELDERCKNSAPTSRALLETLITNGKTFRFRVND